MTDVSHEANSGDLANIDPASCQSFTNCTAIKATRADSASGVYTLVPASGSGAPFQATCDMDFDGGGWTLAMNYVHQGASSPAVNARTDSPPLLASSALGVDESGSDTWGHVAPSLFASLDVGEVRHPQLPPVGGSCPPMSP